MLAQLPTQPIHKLLQWFDIAVCEVLNGHLVHWIRYLCDARAKLQRMKGAKPTTCPFWDASHHDPVVGTFGNPLTFKQAQRIRAKTNRDIRMCMVDVQ